MPKYDPMLEEARARAMGATPAQVDRVGSAAVAANIRARMARERGEEPAPYDPMLEQARASAQGATPAQVDRVGSAAVGANIRARGGNHTSMVAEVAQDLSNRAKRGFEGASLGDITGYLFSALFLASICAIGAYLPSLLIVCLFGARLEGNAMEIAGGLSLLVFAHQMFVRCAPVFVGIQSRGTLGAASLAGIEGLSFTEQLRRDRQSDSTRWTQQEVRSYGLRALRLLAVRNLTWSIGGLLFSIPAWMAIPGRAGFGWFLLIEVGVVVVVTVWTGLRYGEPLRRLNEHRSAPG